LCLGLSGLIHEPSGQKHTDAGALAVSLSLCVQSLLEFPLPGLHHVLGAGVTADYPPDNFGTIPYAAFLPELIQWPGELRTPDLDDARWMRIARGWHLYLIHAISPSWGGENLPGDGPARLEIAGERFRHYQSNELRPPEATCTQEHKQQHNNNQIDS